MKENHEVIVVDDDFDTHCVKKTSRTVKHKTTKSGQETLVITQVNVKKTTLKCVINLPKNENHTSTCKQKLAREKSPYRKKYTSKDREVPQCNRKQCEWMVYEKHKLLKERDRLKTEIKETTLEKMKHSRSSKSRSQQKQMKNNSDYSSVSSLDSVLKSDISYYENVSSDSLETEGDLDTLIKRTKLREKNQMKNQVADKELLQLHTELINTEATKTSDLADDGVRSRGGSIHSQATLVLDQEANGCSQTISLHSEPLPYIEGIYSPISSPQHVIFKSETSPELPIETTPDCTNYNMDLGQHLPAVDPVFTQSYPYCPNLNGSYSLQNTEQDIKPLPAFGTEECNEPSSAYQLTYQQYGYPNFIPNPVIFVPCIYNNSYSLSGNENNIVNMNNNNIDLYKYYFSYWGPRTEHEHPNK